MTDSKRWPTTLVTGANRGIGRGIAIALASRGASLLLHARRPEAAAEIAEVARDKGAEEVLTLAGDLRDEGLASRLSATAESFNLQAAVLNAAVLGPMTPLLDLADDAFDEAMWLNVNAQFRLTKALIPLLCRQSQSALVYLTSGLGRFALPNFGVYTVSKHAIEGLSKQVAADYAGRGLVSCAVAPGMVQTEMLKAATGSEDVSEHESPDRVGQGFAELLATLVSEGGQEHSGASLDIDRWLP